MMRHETVRHETVRDEIPRHERDTEYVVLDSTTAVVPEEHTAHGGTGTVTSTAVVFTAVNTIATRQVTLPTLGPHDVLLRTRLTSISPILEQPLIEGEMAHLPGMEFPLVPGHEAVGEVIAVGERVAPEWLGRDVFVGNARAVDGMNAAWGTQCAHLVAPLDEVVPLEGLHPHRAIFLAQLGAALHSLDLARLEPGSRVLVLGQGTLGQLLARAAQLHGAAHVAVADLSTRHLDLAHAHQPILLPPAAQSHHALWSADLDREVDMLIDTTGDAELVTRWLPGLRRHGILLLLSFYARLELAFLQKPRNGIRIVLSSDWTIADLAQAQRLLVEEQMDLAGLVSHVFPVSHIGQAYVTALGDPDALKVLLQWE